MRVPAMDAFMPTWFDWRVIRYTCKNQEAAGKPGLLHDCEVVLSTHGVSNTLAAILVLPTYYTPTQEHSNLPYQYSLQN